MGTKSNRSESQIALLAILGVPVLVAVVLVASLPISLFYSWAVQKMYDWFLLPIHNFPHLNLWHIWGITLLITIFQGTEQTNDDSPSKTVGRLIGKILGVLFALVIGYFIKGHIR